MRSLVHAAGLRYRVNAKPLSDRRATADLVFTRARVAVFVDGCFWHGCPEHLRPARTNADFWRDKITENRARDAKMTEALAVAGWVSLRFWEHEDPEEVALLIARVVRERRRSWRVRSDASPARR